MKRKKYLKAMKETMSEEHFILAVEMLRTVDVSFRPEVKDAARVIIAYYSGCHKPPKKYREKTA